MSGLRPVPGEPELRSLFASFDLDRSGRLSYRELLVALEEDFALEEDPEVPAAAGRGSGRSPKRGGRRKAAAAAAGEATKGAGRRCA